MDSTICSKRTTVKIIANRVPCSLYHVRRFADSGQLKSFKDYNGWRIFPDPDQAICRLRKLLAISDPPIKNTKGDNDSEIN